MANDTTAAASVQPMTAESAANVLEAMLSSDGDQQDQETQVESQDSDPSEEDVVVDEENAVDDEDTAEEESEQEEDNEQEDEPQKFTVKVDGQEVEVTLDELQAGYSRTSDYTKKTQALAQERKAAQAELEAIRTERQQYAQLLGALQQQIQQVEEPNIDALYESDPIEWVRQKELQRERADKRMAIQAEQQRLMQIQQAEQQQQVRAFLETQKDLLLEKIPQLRDPKVAQAEKQRWMEAGRSVGFSDQELNNVTDHRVLLALKAIADFNGIQTKRQQIKPASNAPKASKPGVAKSANQRSSEIKQSNQRLKSSGNVKDAASLIEKLL